MFLGTSIYLAFPSPTQPDHTDSLTPPASNMAGTSHAPAMRSQPPDIEQANAPFTHVVTDRTAQQDPGKQSPCAHTKHRTDISSRFAEPRSEERQ
jgi:hypothetical protein